MGAGLLPRSLKAVSEAPPSEELGFEMCVGTIRIQRPEESRPKALWHLYLDERVLVVCECAAAGQSAWVSVGMQVTARRDNEESVSPVLPSGKDRRCAKCYS